MQGFLEREPGNVRQGGKPDPRERLTCRQKAIARLLMRGMTNKRIAADLCISQHTVRDHISAMLLKCHADNRMQLVTLFAAHDIAMIAARSPAPTRTPPTDVVLHL